MDKTGMNMEDRLTVFLGKTTLVSTNVSADQTPEQIRSRIPALLDATTEHHPHVDRSSLRCQCLANDGTERFAVGGVSLSQVDSEAVDQAA